MVGPDAGRVSDSDAGANDASEVLPQDVGPRDLAPVVMIDFPSAVALTDATSMTIRGRASDADGVSFVRINGRTADTSDDFASWSLEIPLSVGENTIVVSSEDRVGNTDLRAASAVVTSEPLLFTEPSAAAIDPATGRALLVDPTRDRLVALDLTSGELTLISGEGRGSGPALAYPAQIAVDVLRRRAIIVDGPSLYATSESVLVGIDLDTGDRTILADAPVGEPFYTPAAGVLVDELANRVIVLDSGNPGALIAIDLDTGERTVLSDTATGIGRDLINGKGLAWDVTRDRVLAVLEVTNSAPALVAIDLATGDRTSITDPLEEFGMRQPRGVTVDAEGHRAFVAVGGAASSDMGALLAIDLDDGTRTVVSGPATGTGLDLGGPIAVSFDGATRRAQVISFVARTAGVGYPALVTIDVDTGARAIAGERTVGAGPAITGPTGVALDAAHDRALLADHRGMLVAVDLRTGDRTIISEPEREEWHPFSPGDVVLDEAHDRVLVIDTREQALVSIQLGTGADTVIAGTGPEMAQMSALALDAAANRVLIVGSPAGRGPDAPSSMVAVDLSSGDRSALIESVFGTGQWDLFFLGGVTVDAANARALVTRLDVNTTTDSETLLAVDLATSARTVVASEGFGAGPPLSAPGAVVFDASERQAYALSDARRVMRVDVETGERTILSDSETGTGPPLILATDLDLSSSSRCALVTDDVLDALVLVDLVTGERVILSGHAAY